jgi:hypothetical protein
MSDRLELIMRVITRLIICAALAGCGKSTPPLTAMTKAPCAAEKPVINLVHLDGHFVITDDDMGQLAGYIAALEEGCIAPK